MPRNFLFILRTDCCQSCSGNKREQNSYCQSRNLQSSSDNKGNFFLLPEQNWIDGDARPVGDIFSEHLST